MCIRDSLWDESINIKNKVRAETKIKFYNFMAVLYKFLLYDTESSTVRKVDVNKFTAAETSCLRVLKRKLKIIYMF